MDITKLYTPRPTSYTGSMLESLRRFKIHWSIIFPSYGASRQEYWEVFLMHILVLSTLGWLTMSMWWYLVSPVVHHVATWVLYCGDKAYRHLSVMQHLGAMNKQLNPATAEYEAVW